MVRVISATELRVHLGETLRGLEDGEIIIEKGGVPVAVLRRYVPVSAPFGGLAEAEYGRAVAKGAEPDGWVRMDAAMAAGWSGLEADELVANIYRGRDAGARLNRHYNFDDDEPEGSEDDPGVSAGQRRLRGRDPEAKYVADGDGETYQA